MSTSRLIVKNIPKIIDEVKIQKHFSKFGDVTDVKIVFRGNVNRRFCFIGYKTVEAAEKAQQYFNNTYLYMSKITVDFAKTKDQLEQEYDQNNQQKNNKFNKRNNQNNEKNQDNKQGEEEKKELNEQEEQLKNDKKRKFKEFLELMKVGSKGTMSWNDVIEPEYNEEEDQNNNGKNKKQKKQKKKQDQQQQVEDEQEQLDGNLNDFENQINSNSKNTKKKAKLEADNDTNQDKQNKNKTNNEEQQSQQQQQQAVAGGNGGGGKIVDEKRLYVINLPYSLNEQDVKDIFQKYGKIENLKMPKTQEGLFKGFAFVTFSQPEEAMRAFSELDNKIVYGRILHLRPAYEDENQKKIDEKKKDNIDEELKKTDPSSYKKQKKIQMRKKLEDQTNWNTLFLNPNSILESIASKFSMKKSEILSDDADNLAVRVANAETQIINETKQWMLKQNLNLDFLEQDRQQCERSNNVILVKNLSHKVNQSDLEDLFSHYGIVDRVLLSPNKALAIVEYAQSQHAQNSFENLSYHPFMHNPLYLEWAPIGLMDKIEVQQKSKENQMQQEDQDKSLSKVLYVKNLNFDTTEKQLREHFDKANVGEIRSVKIVKRKDGQSNGYGFIEFCQEESVMNSIKKLQSSMLDGHLLQLSYSRQQKNEVNKQNKKKNVNNDIKATNKLVIRNLAFQATKKEIRDLFITYGEVKAVRLPKKMNGQHRGFAFVEFVSTEEAKNAFSSLQNTHLYGRKLVLEWSANDEVIEKQSQQFQ